MDGDFECYLGFGFVISLGDLDGKERMMSVNGG